MATTLVAGTPVSPDDKYVINLVPITPVPVSALINEQDSRDEMEEELERLKAERALLLSGADAPPQDEPPVTPEPEPASASATHIAKNHVAQKVALGRRYVLLMEELPKWGKVPQQQADIADIIARCFEVNVEIPEADLFDALTKLAKQYPQLANSKQHVTYLFRYYRGLKNNGKHAGFVGRNFIRVLG